MAACPRWMVEGAYITDGRRLLEVVEVASAFVRVENAKSGVRSRYPIGDVAGLRLVRVAPRCPESIFREA